MAGGGNVGGGGAGGGQMASRPPNPFQYSPQGNLTGSFGSQGDISGSDLNNFIGRNMGNYGYTVNALNQAGIGQPDVATMAGIQPENVYTYMNRPSPYTDQFYQQIYQPQYSTYSASPQATFGVAAYGTNPTMRQDILTRGMQTTPYYGFGGGNLDMFGLPSVVSPFTYNPQLTGLNQNYSFNPRRTINPPADDRRVVQGGSTFVDTMPRVMDELPPGSFGHGTDMSNYNTGFGGFGGGGFGGADMAGRGGMQALGMATELSPETRAALSATAATATNTPEYTSFASRAQQMGYTPQYASPYAQSQQQQFQPQLPPQQFQSELFQPQQLQAQQQFQQQLQQLQSQQQPGFGFGMPAAPQPIASRSSQVRGRPNVMRRAEGGIADLLSK